MNRTRQQIGRERLAQLIQDFVAGQIRVPLMGQSVTVIGPKPVQKEHRQLPQFTSGVERAQPPEVEDV